MARLDDDGAIQQVNRALCEILGVREGVLLGRTLDAITHPDDVDDRRQASGATCCAGGAGRYEVEKRLLDAQGGEVDAQLSFSVARDDDGALRALLVQVQDIRERRRAQRGARGARPRAGRARRGRGVGRRASARSARSPTRRSRRSASTTCCASCSRASPTCSASTARRSCSSEEAPGPRRRARRRRGRRVRRASTASAIDGGLADADHARAARRSSSPTPRRDRELADHPLGAAVTSLLGVPLLAGERADRRAARSGRCSRGASPRTRSTCCSSPPTARRWRSSACGSSSASRRSPRSCSARCCPQSLPAVPGLAMAARYLPGGAGTRVGGDWYDTIALPGGRVALVIGDVAGRGVDAAAMMGQLRSALRAYVARGRDAGARRSSA